MLTCWVPAQLRMAPGGGFDSPRVMSSVELVVMGLSPTSSMLTSTGLGQMAPLVSPVAGGWLVKTSRVAGPSLMVTGLLVGGGPGRVRVASVAVSV